MILIFSWSVLDYVEGEGRDTLRKRKSLSQCVMYFPPQVFEETVAHLSGFLGREIVLSII